MPSKKIFAQLTSGVLLLAILVILCHCLPRLDSLTAVIIVALLMSALVSVVSGYCYIVKATKASMTYAPKSWVTWLYSRRIFTYVFFILIPSFLCALWFVINVPTLKGHNLAFIFLTVPMFALVYWSNQRLLKGQSVDWLITGRTIVCSLLITPIIMAALYGIYLNYADVPVYLTLKEAIDAQPVVWCNSQSVNLRHIADWTSLFGGSQDFLIGQAFQVNSLVTTVLVAIGQFALFFNVCAVLSSVFIPTREYKRLAIPLVASSELPGITTRQIALTCSPLIAVSVACLIIANISDKQIVHSPEPVRQYLVKIVDDLITQDLAKNIEEEYKEGIELIIGRHRRTVEMAERTLTDYRDNVKNLQNSLTNIRENAHDEIAGLLEQEIYPCMERNVDTFLNWYYTILGGYARLGNMIIRNFDNYMEKQLETHLMANVDGQRVSAIISKTVEEGKKILIQLDQLEKLAKQQSEQYAKAVEEMTTELEDFKQNWTKTVNETIAANKILPENTPAGEIVSEYPSTEDFLSSFQNEYDYSLISSMKTVIAEIQSLLNIFSRGTEANLFLTLNKSGSVAGGGAIGALVAKRVAGQQAFKTAASMAVKVLTKALGPYAAVGGGAAVGGAGGSIIPGPGTAAGAVIGGIAGLGIWIGTDYAFTKTEEAFTREKWKREILKEINEHKVETLHKLEEVFQVKETKSINYRQESLEQK